MGSHQACGRQIRGEHRKDRHTTQDIDRGIASPRVALQMLGDPVCGGPVLLRKAGSARTTPEILPSAKRPIRHRSTPSHLHPGVVGLRPEALDGSFPEWYL